MKRTILDITNIISRKAEKIILKPYDLNDNTYSMWIAKGWRYAPILREIEYRNTQKRLKIRVNTQNINPVDFLAEQSSEGLIIKFIKKNFEYPLDDLDEIILTGDLEQYA
jgi:hypothetical protein